MVVVGPEVYHQLESEASSTQPSLHFDSSANALKLVGFKVVLHPRMWPGMVELMSLKEYEDFKSVYGECAA